MNQDREEKLADLISQTKEATELASMAASMLEEWCNRSGTDLISITTFLNDFVEAQFDDDIRNALLACLKTYKPSDEYSEG